MICPTVRGGDCDLGRGLFALKEFCADERILILHGPRFEREDPIHHREEGANLLQTGPRTYIMLQEPGVLANHSCDPNAGIRGNRSMVAIRPIHPGDEIRFDYSTTMDEGLWTMPCRCGSPRCRGLVTDFHTLPAPVQRRYLDLDIVQAFIARRARPRPHRMATLSGADRRIIPSNEDP